MSGGFLIADGGRLLFDPDLHRFTSEGVLVPSVSQVLRGVGMIDRQWYREEHSARGTAVHEIAHRRLLAPPGGRPDPAAAVLAPGYLASIDLFCQTHRPEPLLAEHPVHLPKRAAGILDFFGTINGQRLNVLLDWKTGPFQWWHEAQTAGYAQMLRAMGLRVDRRGSVHLQLSGCLPDVKWHTSAAGQQDWDSALYLVERRLQHHGRDERIALCSGSPPGGPGPEADDFRAGDGAIH